MNTGLDEIAKYSDAIGPWKETIAPGSGTTLPINYTTNLVDRFACNIMKDLIARASSANRMHRRAHCSFCAPSLLKVTFCLFLQGARARPAGAPVHVPQ